METELRPLLKSLKATESKKLINIYPLYKARHQTADIFVVETFVGEANASIAGFEAIREVNPDYVIKFGAVGGSYPESKAREIIIPLGFFHRTGWITKDQKTHIPTADASKWDSIYGEKDYQIQESRHNLGGMSYYFSVPERLQRFCENTLRKHKMKYVTAYVGGGDMWMTNQQVLNNVAATMLPASATHRRFVSDMESYSLAHACYLTKKPFIGCYVVASNDYINELYNPELVPAQMERLVPYALELIKTFG